MYTCQMAANQVQTEGYECNWTEDPPDDLKCQICLMVAKDPQQHGGNKGCGKIFCNSCITVHQSNSRNCPNCREQLSLFEDKRSILNIYHKMLYDLYLQLYCRCSPYQCSGSEV